jgi:hypothetical protein
MAMGDSPHAAMLAMGIQRFLERPAEPMALPGMPEAPPGAPIGQPAMDWLGGLGIGRPATQWLAETEATCTWHEGGWH